MTYLCGTCLSETLTPRCPLCARVMQPVVRCLLPPFAGLVGSCANSWNPPARTVFSSTATESRCVRTFDLFCA